MNKSRDGAVKLYLLDGALLRRCTEKPRAVMDFYLFLAATFVVARELIHCTRSRWPTRPTTCRLR